MNFQKISILILCAGVIILLFTQKAQIIIRFISLRFAALEYHDTNGKTLRYRLFKPRYDTTKKYPLIIYLHGGAQKGDDNLQQLNKTLYIFSSGNILKNHPSFVMAPQCPKDAKWVDYKVTSVPFDHYVQKDIP